MSRSRYSRRAPATFKKHLADAKLVALAKARLKAANK